MDTQTLKIIIYVIVGGFVLLMFFRKLGSKKRKCVICESETLDTYNDLNDKSLNMCRAHLIENWKKDVLASKNNMVVIEPDVEDKNYSMGYLYADIDQLGLWEYGKLAQDNMTRYLEMIIVKKCEQCDSVANVAYFKKDDYEIPMMEKISATPKFLCKNCMIKKIAPMLEGSQNDFFEGVYAPIGGNGVYHSQEF